jgi:cytosine/creatinine deaminase
MHAQEDRDGHGNGCIPRVVMGENRTFVGGEDYVCARGVEVINLDSQECVDLMNEFIAAHPEIWYEDIGEPRDA